MINITHRLALLPCVLCLTVSAQNPPTQAAGREPKAPPTPPPTFYAPAEPGPQPGGGPQYGPQFWSAGQPTDEEQLYLEYINRARANPTQEGIRLANTTDPDVLGAYEFFVVDLGLMQFEFSTNLPAPPLAMNAQLLAAARLHSGDMFTNQFQGHVSSTGLDLAQRVQAQGYNYSTLGENVYSYADSVWHGHAGFDVDWGPGPGGMQPARGHRVNIHSPSFREVGIGVVNGVNGTVGPQLVTQDFGTRQGATPMVTGVVYFDLNDNNFYDIGEGIGGVTVDLPGSAFHSITATSGGYAVPASTNGTYVVNFTAPSLSYSTTATVSSGRNVKVDYVPVYSPPVTSGPNPATFNAANTYTFTPVPGATAYDWQRSILGDYTIAEGAETLANVTITTVGGYAVQSADRKFAGMYSFHLAHPSNASGPPDEAVTLNATILPSATSQLSFYKWLGWANTTQIARAQVSTDDGVTWQTVWSQAGTGGAGENGFTRVSVPLASYANQFIRVRFVYDYTGGSYYYQTDSAVGLLLDDIAVSSARFVLSPVVMPVISGTSFTFTPATLTNHLLAVRARVGGRIMNWGPGMQVAVTVALPPPVVTVRMPPRLASGQMQVDFDVTNYRDGMIFELWKSPILESGWTADPGATLTTLIPNLRFRLTTPMASEPRMFYRVRATY